MFKRMDFKRLAAIIVSTCVLVLCLPSMGAEAAADLGAAEILSFTQCGYNVYTASHNATYVIEVVGGAGGGSGYNPHTGYAFFDGGAGGKLSFTVNLYQGQTIQMYIGSAGSTSAPGVNGASGCGGYGTGYCSGCGGAATEVYLDGNLLAIAGGGGGGMSYGDGVGFYGGDAGSDFSGGNINSHAGTSASDVMNAGGGGGGFYGGICGTTSRMSYGGTNFCSGSVSCTFNGQAENHSGGYVTITRLSEFVLRVNPTGGEYLGNDAVTVYSTNNSGGWETPVIYDRHASIEIPSDGNYYVQVWGAEGGDDAAAGGYGGYVQAYLQLSEGTVIFGTNGGCGQTQNADERGLAGFNGGADAGYSGGWSGTGGGCTSLALVQHNTLYDLRDSKESVLVVAGGGAGGGAQESGRGGEVLYSSKGGQFPGTVITGDTAWLNGNFCYGSNPGNDIDGGGGGGGWVGGRYGDDSDRMAGGGASYVNLDYGYPISLTPNANASAGHWKITKVGDAVLLDKPIRDGYHFNGWYKAFGTGSLDYNNLADRYIYTYGEGTAEVQALWSRDYSGLWILNVNPNGGTWGGTSEVSERVGTTGSVASIPDPVRVGWMFTGWSLSGPGVYGNRTYTFGQGDASLVANWQIASPFLTLDANGGLYNETMDSTPNTTSFTGVPTKTYQMTFNSTKRIYDPYRRGYTFVEWNARNASDGYLDNNKLWHFNTTNELLQAQWIENTFNIHYASNKPARASSEVLRTTRNQDNLLWSQSYALSSNQYRLRGWTWDGWSLSPGDNNTVQYSNRQVICNATDNNFADNPSGLTYTLYPVWHENTYTLRYWNDQTGTYTEQKDLLFENTYHTLYNGIDMDYRKDGYYIAYWQSPDGYVLKADPLHENDDFALESFQGLTTVDKAVINLYPVWMPITYYIQWEPCSSDFTGNDVQGTRSYDVKIPEFKDANSKVTCHLDNLSFQANNSPAKSYTEKTVDAVQYRYDETYTVPLNPYSGAHANTFQGWSVDPDAYSGVVVQGNQIKNVTVERNQIITLYAVFDLYPELKVVPPSHMSYNDGESNSWVQNLLKTQDLNALSGTALEQHLIETCVKSVSDREDGSAVQVYVSNFDKEQLGGIDRPTLMTITFTAKDSIGQCTNVTTAWEIYKDGKVNILVK